MSFIPSERITEATSSKVEFSVFEFLDFDKGSAIYVINPSWTLDIEKCLFRFCLSSTYGGAINVKASSICITDTCFDTCFIIGGQADVFGNAVYGISDNSNKAEINFTSFLCCGPKLSISSDSTIFLQKFSPLLSNLNFTRCSSTNGAASISIDSSSTKVSFIDVFRGTSSHISCVLGSSVLSFSKSNFIDWTPSDKNHMFWTNYGKTSLEDCCLYIFNPTNELGNNVIFSNCYGNVASATKIATTRIELLKNRADDYCRHVLTNSDGANRNPIIGKLCIILSLFVN